MLTKWRIKKRAMQLNGELRVAKASGDQEKIFEVGARAAELAQEAANRNVDLSGILTEDFSFKIS